MNVFKKKAAIIAAYIVAIVAVLGIAGFTIISFGDSKENSGFIDGLVQGRREVVDAILINVANEGNVVIRQGEQSITLILERDGDTALIDGIGEETPTP